MTTSDFIEFALTPALRILPPAMDSPNARALLLTIAWQESRMKHRQQLKGPARGYFQFELGGCAAVMWHAASRPHILTACRIFDITPTPEALLTALEYHDIVAVMAARCLLWTLPQSLPREDDVATAWHQYIDAWNPGRPHETTWAGYYHTAWMVVKGEPPTDLFA
jgi:hypothetical protein